MLEIEFPAGNAPSAAIACFKLWSRVRDEPELAIRASSTVGRVSPTVLLAACASERGVRGLITRVEVDGTWGPVEAAFAREPLDTRSFEEPSRTLVCAHTDSLSGARRAAEWVADALAVRAPALSPSIIRMVRFVFEELGANVVQHSDAPRTGVGWADVDAQSKRLALSFADCGVGIRASLQRNPELAGRIADDAEALQLALSPRISGTGPTRSNMGWGLKSLVDLSDLLSGEMYIASGDAMLTRRTSAGQRTNVVREVPEWQGCWIALEAPLG